MAKIFCIGSNKTGTTSMRSALENLSFSVAPEQLSYKHISKVQDGDYKEIFDLVDQYDAFEDRPWNHTDFYKVLDTTYKDANFILTTRDVDQWWESYLRWDEKVNLRGHLHYNLTSNICYNVDSFLDNEDIAKKAFIDRNESIINHFSGRSNLMVIDLSKTNDIHDLCLFLGKEGISSPFPHHNKTV